MYYVLTYDAYCSACYVSTNSMLTVRLQHC